MNTWNEFFNSIENKEYCKRLHEFLNHEYYTRTIFPPRNLLFNAFKLTPLQNVKVVIVGQDPYHEIHQAMGLSFSVMDGVKVPPSLINIYKEIESEYDISIDKSNGNLTNWAKQGVLLLNSILSVRESQTMSHDIDEYKMFFEDVLAVLDAQEKPIVFMLWGGSARKLKKFIHNPNHLILESVHPSPLAAIHGGWFGNNHFIKCNEFLKANGRTPIDWSKHK